MLSTNPHLSIKLEFAVETEITRKPEAEELADNVADRLMLIENSQICHSKAQYYNLVKSPKDGSYLIEFVVWLTLRAVLKSAISELEAQLKSINIIATWN